MNGKKYRKRVEEEKKVKEKSRMHMVQQRVREIVRAYHYYI